MKRFRNAVLGVMLVMSAPALAQQTVKVDGSTGGMPIIKALAEAFAKAEPGDGFGFGAGLGTRARLEALGKDEIALAVASHGLDVPALTARGFRVIEVARAPVVFAAHASVGLKALTAAQICGI